jgi:hypothetical protein
MTLEKIRELLFFHDDFLKTTTFNIFLLKINEINNEIDLKKELQKQTD